MGTANKLTLLGLFLVLQLTATQKGCNKGFISLQDGSCKDDDECLDIKRNCGDHADCFNTNGSFYCQCQSGFRSSTTFNFTAKTGQCTDVHECRENSMVCGNNAVCKNTIGSFNCSCNPGYIKKDDICDDIDECESDPTMCGPEVGGVCRNLPGSYWCECNLGHSNYGHNQSRCSVLNCDQFKEESALGQSVPGLADLFSMIRDSCQALTNPDLPAGTLTGKALLENLFTATDTLLSPGDLGDSTAVSGLLGAVEDVIKLIGPQLNDNHTKMETFHTEAELAVRRGQTPPTGPIRLTNEDASLNTSWEVATAPVATYPGYALAALVIYKNLEREPSISSSFENLVKPDSYQTPSYQLNSKVVTAVVSNPDTQQLAQPVGITFRHLQEGEESKYRKYTCVYWEGGAWSTTGCTTDYSSATHTVCNCTHLSSFAVLMALYPIEDTFELQLLTRLGLSVSLVCLSVCIATFLFCRSIQGTRTTIHLHLCLCLFIADFVFLIGITRTQPQAGCALVAGLLHLFFLASFSWMLLEGVQLYRMVVLVFNTTIRPLYLHAAGYGLPLLVVAVSAIARPGGYGTDVHCWLSLKDDLIWSFYGPVCFIIMLNVVFFGVTVWKLAQKFSSLNPDLSNLRKIKTFTVTAVAQLCVLGLMWVFGAFLFQDHGSPALLYLFTILNSLQGALVFTMHCLLSKQVREEYSKLLSICTPQKKRYSDFSTTANPSSQSQGSKTAQNTAMVQI